MVAARESHLANAVAPRGFKQATEPGDVRRGDVRQRINLRPARLRQVHLIDVCDQAVELYDRGRRVIESRLDNLEKSVSNSEK